MSQITTHILDTALGKPAKGVAVTLQKSNGGNWETLAEGRTDKDGRISNLLPSSQMLDPGDYRMHFVLEPYFMQTAQTCFYPEASIMIRIKDRSHYHIPLLLSPFAYSTYRGS